MELRDARRFFRFLILLFLGLFFVLYALGFVPAAAKEAFLAFVRPSDFDSFATKDLYLQGVKISVVETWAASRIVISKIRVDSPVILSTKSDFAFLNADLLKGAVHYPKSAMPGKTGNVLIFGHSTTLPAVYHPIYKIFNRLKELKPGDKIELRSDTRGYAYVVRNVEIKKANDAKIDLTSDRKLLTLSTCNIIGGKESRYVVTAEFLRSYPLGS